MKVDEITHNGDLYKVHRDGNSIKLYKNGELVKSKDGAKPLFYTSVRMTGEELTIKVV